MVAHLMLSSTVKNKENETPKLHWMPCVIKTNGKAEVSKYFEPIIVKRNDGVLKASFRGYPLFGKEVDLPQNYSGVVLQQTNEKLNEDADRNLYGVKMFDKFTYWNWDIEPSGNDKIITAMDWLDIAEAVSKSYVSNNEDTMKLPSNDSCLRLANTFSKISEMILKKKSFI